MHRYLLVLLFVVLCGCATSPPARVQTPACTRLQQCAVTMTSVNPRARALLTLWQEDRVNVVIDQTNLMSWTAQNPPPWSPEQQTTYNRLHAQLVFYSRRMVDNADAYNALIASNRELLNDHSLLPHLETSVSS
jgi:hypothetical protein